MPLPHDGPLDADEEPLEDNSAGDEDDNFYDEEPDRAEAELDEPDRLDRDPFA